MVSVRNLVSHSALGITAGIVTTNQNKGCKNCGRRERVLGALLGINVGKMRGVFVNCFLVQGLGSDLPV